MHSLLGSTYMHDSPSAHSVWLRGCRHVHTCMHPTRAWFCMCLYQPCVEVGEFPKFNSRFTFGFRWIFWAAIRGLPFGVWQTWKRYINQNPNSIKSFLFFVGVKLQLWHDSLNFKGQEHSSYLPDRKTHYAEFCTHFTDFSPSIDQYLRYFWHGI